MSHQTVRQCFYGSEKATEKRVNARQQDHANRRFAPIRQLCHTGGLADAAGADLILLSSCSPDFRQWELAPGSRSYLVTAMAAMRYEATLEMMQFSVA